MLIIGFMIMVMVSSQNQIVKVVYNDKNFLFYLHQLTVKNIMSTFNISEILLLEDLSGVRFFPLIDGTYPSYISSEVYVRQSIPKQVPVVIYPSESKFVYNTGNWHTGYWEIMVGRCLPCRDMRVGYAQFKDLSSIDRKRKILRVYLRMIGTSHESILPSQIFVYRCETDWANLISWSEQPVVRNEPYSSLILGEVLETSFFWDVTDIVLDWVSGLLPNYGISLKTNSTFSLPTIKQFHNNHPIKRPCLLVYYSS